MAAYILNCLPSKSVFDTPYELWHDRKPTLDHLYLWSLASYAHIPAHTHGKFDPKPTKMVFIRYPEHFKRYAMFGEHPNSGMMEVESRNVEFLNDEFLSDVV